MDFEEIRTRLNTFRIDDKTWEKATSALTSDDVEKANIDCIRRQVERKLAELQIDICFAEKLPETKLVKKSLHQASKDLERAKQSALAAITPHTMRALLGGGLDSPLEKSEQIEFTLSSISDLANILKAIGDSIAPMRQWDKSKVTHETVHEICMIFISHGLGCYIKRGDDKSFISFMSIIMKSIGATRGIKQAFEDFISSSAEIRFQN
jgi:hypothetical protein